MPQLPSLTGRAAFSCSSHFRIHVWAFSVLLYCAAVCQAAPPLTGAADPQLEVFDKLLTSFVGGHKIPGAALAVSYRGKLVYARGCGYADVAKREEVQPNSLFRSASLTKPITAVAVLKLMEQGKLKLEDPILNHLSDVVPGAQRKNHPWSKITIQHCLQHTAGWDSKAKFDPMFRSIMIADALKVPTPPTSLQIIRFMASKRPDFAPGERYAYSNFGYVVLGRVIEQASGQSYEEYVQEQIFKTLGIKSARLAKTRLKDRAPQEVRYYDGNKKARNVFSQSPADVTPMPYGTWSIEAMDSNGGWLLSAADLARFMCGLDLSSKQPLIKPETRQLLLRSRPSGPAGFEANGKPKSDFYGFGWRIQHGKTPDQAHYWHESSFDGISGLMIHRDDEVNWVILINTTELVKGKLPAEAIDQLLHDAMNSVKVWPEKDLFSTIDQLNP